VNTSSPEPEPAEPPATADTMLNIEPPVDTSSTDSLSDSLGTADTSSSVRPAATALSAAAADSTAKAAQAAPDSGTRVRLEALTDSVWLRVLPAGARESSRYLRLEKPVDYTHHDAITFITRKGGIVRVTTGDRETVPTERRFKVDGSQITE